MPSDTTEGREIEQLVERAIELQQASVLLEEMARNPQCWSRLPSATGTGLAMSGMFRAFSPIADSKKTVVCIHSISLGYSG